jgi:hypothetical protein
MNNSILINLFLKNLTPSGIWTHYQNLIQKHILNMLIIIDQILWFNNTYMTKKANFIHFFWPILRMYMLPINCVRDISSNWFQVFPKFALVPEPKLKSIFCSRSTENINNWLITLQVYIIRLLPIIDYWLVGNH